jgi:hypothetical protein
MAGTDVLRTREHRMLFQRAIRENVTLAEARRREAADRWAVADARLAKRKTPCAIDIVPDDNDEGQPLAWWQR